MMPYGHIDHSQQAITWANVDQILCYHVALLDHNELIEATY